MPGTSVSVGLKYFSVQHSEYSPTFRFSASSVRIPIFVVNLRRSHTMSWTSEGTVVTATCNFLAGIAFLTWDILITMDIEVNFIWSRPWSSTSFLYLYVRYFPLIAGISTWPIGSTASSKSHFSQYQCTIWEAFDMFSTMTIMASVEYILLRRICAVYHRHPIIQTIVKILYTIDLVCMIIGYTLSISKFVFDSHCTVLSGSRLLIIYGASTPAFHSVLFILTLTMFLSAIQAERKSLGTLAILTRDGTWAFFLIEAVMVTNAIPYFVDPSLSLLGWMRCALSFVGYRLILNLRACEYATEDLSVQSDLAFGRPVEGSGC